MYCFKVPNTFTNSLFDIRHNFLSYQLHNQFVLKDSIFDNKNEKQLYK